MVFQNNSSSAVWFVVSGGGFAWYFVAVREQFWALWGFLAAMAPVFIYFTIWFYFTLNNQKYASYGWAMWMNRISALALNAFFIWYLLISQSGG